ncbi:MAG: 5-bromo-4-chloroindolyl phosphate hydrolysis family protein [Eubacteriales bacterium]|nr:5-bromo-4-chloroindolyl phosphate hydrolysis family protein [Eubacteriales bacterium]
MKVSGQVLLSLVIALGIFSLLGFVLKWSLLVAALLSVLSYFAVYLLSRPKLRIGNIVIEDYRKGDELRALLDDAYEDMEAIRKASRSITNLNIQNEARKLYKTGTKILEYLSHEPDKINLARRFFSYYLNTARGILEKYLKIQSSELQTEEVRQVTRSTEAAMPVLNQAFEKQFSNLIANDLMDIEEDIKLLKINLKMEG